MVRMQERSVCHIFEAIGNRSAIGKVAMAGVRAALDAGFRVTVVARYLDETLRPDVEWLVLDVPKRLFILQWLTARHYIRRALGGRRFDLIHAHQPQVAALADVFQCHYLTRVAHERQCLDSSDGARGAFNRLQQLAVMPVEDRYYKNWKPKTKMLFNSRLTQKDFHRLYGKPSDERILIYSCPPYEQISSEQRRKARLKFLGSGYDGIVVGHMGGLNERKGYRRVVNALKGQRDIFFLLGGPFCEGFKAPEMDGHFKSVGMVNDIAGFYSACDILIVPSLYESFGLVASEALAYGVPVIATEEVGALPHLEEYRAGVAWHPGDPLAPLIREVCARRNEFIAGGKKMVEDFGAEACARRLIAIYKEVIDTKEVSEDVVWN